MTRRSIVSPYNNCIIMMNVSVIIWECLSVIVTMKMFECLCYHEGIFECLFIMIRAQIVHMREQLVHVFDHTESIRLPSTALCKWFPVPCTNEHYYSLK